MPRSNYERLFVDLIFSSSQKYPNWDPEVVVLVGDYGRIVPRRRGLAFWKKNRGTFLKEGNIYADGIAEKYHILDPVEHGTSSTDGMVWIFSDNARQILHEAGAAVQTPALVQCSLKVAFEFSSSGGAVLAMSNVTVSTIDPPGILRHLLADPDMKGFVVVSEVHQCSSYARFVTTQKGSTVGIGLSVAPAMVSDMASAGMGAQWVHSARAGNFKANINGTGKRVFYPLMKLASLTNHDVAIGQV